MWENEKADEEAGGAVFPSPSLAGTAGTGRGGPLLPCPVPPRTRPPVEDVKGRIGIRFFVPSFFFSGSAFVPRFFGAALAFFSVFDVPIREKFQTSASSFPPVIPSPPPPGEDVMKESERKEEGEEKRGEAEAEGVVVVLAREGTRKRNGYAVHRRVGL